MTTKTKLIRELSTALSQLADVMESGDPAQIPALCVRIEALEGERRLRGAVWLAETIRTFGFERAIQLGKLATHALDVVASVCEAESILGTVHESAANHVEVIESVASLCEHGINITPVELLAACWDLSPSQARRELKALMDAYNPELYDEAVPS